MTTIDGEEIDTSRSDVPGPGCHDQGCPRYYETGPIGRCGECNCVIQFMSLAGKGCPLATAEKEEATPSK